MLTKPLIHVCSAAMLIACTACNSPQPGNNPDFSETASGGQPSDTLADDGASTPGTATEAGAAQGQSGPLLDMTGTGWRVTGEDGSIYTSFLDPDGNYRDFRNGTLWQTGTWERRGDGRLCFTPDDEDRVGECWTNDPPIDDGTMLTTNDAGRTIELLRVTYIPAEEA